MSKDQVSDSLQKMAEKNLLDGVEQQLPEVTQFADSGKPIPKAEPSPDANITGVVEDQENKDKGLNFQCNCACPKASDVTVAIANGVIAGSMVQVSVIEPVI